MKKITHGRWMIRCALVCAGLSLAGVTKAQTVSEDFDSVSAPALPAGWLTSAEGSQSNWVTTTFQSDSPPNAVFSPAPSNIGVNELVTPPILLPATPAELTFRHAYNMEVETNLVGIAYDGGVLEIKIGNGSFTNITSVGGSFVTNGYNYPLISACCGNPLGNNAGWSGSSTGFVTTIVSLPAASRGQMVRLRWRCGTDDSNEDAGWYIDDISVDGSSLPVLGGARRTNGVFHFLVSGRTGQVYAIERKTHVAATNWSEIGSVSNSTGIVPFSDGSSSAGTGFYRARIVP